MKECVDNLKANLKYLQNLLNSILDLQQIKAKKIKLNLSYFQLEEVVRTLKQIFEFQCAQKNIFFRIDSSIPLHERINSDKDRLIQILINLCSNALKFTRIGGITVTIRHTLDPNFFEFRVSDSGVGMKQDDLKKLFQAFSKIESTNSLNPHGVGLGLMISNSLCRILSNGREENDIKVESEHGVGSSFYFQTRVRKERAEGFECSIIESMIDQSESQYSRTLRSKKSNFVNKHILLVDDIHFNLLTAKKLLGGFGYMILTASNGLEAISIVEKHANTLKLILMDIEMPIMDGIEATKKIVEMMKNQKIPFIPIVGTSGHVDENIVKKCMEIGMSQYLRKPFMKQDVIKIISGISFDKKIDEESSQQSESH